MLFHSRELEFTLVSAPSPHSIHRSQNNWHQPTNDHETATGELCSSYPEGAVGIVGLSDRAGLRCLGGKGAAWEICRDQGNTQCGACQRLQFSFFYAFSSPSYLHNLFRSIPHTSPNSDQVEVDVFGEKLSQSEMKQKAKEAQVMAAEAEFNRLNRRVQELEEDLENTETKFVLGSQKLDKAATTADDSDRMKKVLENRAADDEKKLVRLAEELKEAQKQAEDADKMYDETQKKMMETERNLEVSDERASVGEFKIIELEEELKVVANNLRSLEVSEDKANKRESHYKEEIKRLTVKLKQSETRSEFAERSVLKLQKEVKVS